MWDSGVSRDEALGSASLNLDMAVENSIQDRWLQLVGEETGELRVRIAVVPGDVERCGILTSMFIKSVFKSYKYISEVRFEIDPS